MDFKTDFTELSCQLTGVFFDKIYWLEAIMILSIIKIRFNAQSESAVTSLPRNY